MGRGSSTREVNVRKHLPTLQSQGSGTGGNGGGSSDKDPESNSCLFSFILEMSVNDDLVQGIKLGDKAAIIPNSGILSVIVAGYSIGTYTGKYMKRILECLKQKFAYAGEVVTIGSNKVQVSIKGYKR